MGRNTVSPNGYKQIKFDGVRYMAHRIIFLMANGHMPEFDVDHINGDRTDNRPANLRPATRQQNVANKRPSDGKRKGVTCLGVGRWSAKIGHNQRTIYLGSYKTEEAAAAAYAKAAVEIYGEFARW